MDDEKRILDGNELNPDSSDANPGFGTDSSQNSQPYQAGQSSDSFQNSQPYQAGQSSDSFQNNQPYQAGPSSDSFQNNQPYQAGQSSDSFQNSQPYQSQPYQSQPTYQFDGGDMGDDATMEWEEKRGAGKILMIIGIVVLVLLLLAAGTAVVFAKTNLIINDNERIAMAMMKTSEDSPLAGQFMKADDLMKSNELNANFNVNIKSAEISYLTLENMEINLNSGADIKNQLYSYDASLNYAGLTPNIKGMMTDHELVISTSLLADKYYSYDYTAENPSGYFVDTVGSDNIKNINNLMVASRNVAANKDIFSENCSKITKKHILDLPVKRIDSKNCMINGKEKKCKGYSATITKDNLTAYLNDMGTEYQSFYGDVLSSAQLLAAGNSTTSETDVNSTNPFNSIVTALNETEFTQFDCKFYTQKGKLAEIELSLDGSNVVISYNGGDYRSQNMTVLIQAGGEDGSSITIAKKGSISGSTETGTFSVTAESQTVDVANYTYDSKSGAYTLAVTIPGASQEYKVGGILKCDSGEMVCSIETISGIQDLGYDFKASMTCTDKYTAPEMTGTKTDILSLSETDVNNIMDELQTGIEPLTTAFSNAYSYSWDDYLEDYDYDDYDYSDYSDYDYSDYYDY